MTPPAFWQVITTAPAPIAASAVMMHRTTAATFNGIPLLCTHRPLDAPDHARQLVAGVVGTKLRV